MASREIDSFVRKFQQLWSAGFSAHLDLDSDAGEAWVGLRVKLCHGRGQRDPPTFIGQNLIVLRVSAVVINEQLIDKLMKIQ